MKAFFSRDAMLSSPPKITHVTHVRSSEKGNIVTLRYNDFAPNGNSVTLSKYV